MSDEFINKFLCERVEKKCFHEFEKAINGYYYCQSSCKGKYGPFRAVLPSNPNYLHSGNDYIRLMQAARKETWWADFRASFRHIKSKDEFKPWLYCHFDEIILDPSRGARALAEFLGYKEDGNG